MGSTNVHSPAVQRFLAPWFSRYYASCVLEVERPAWREWMRFELDGQARRPLYYETLSQVTLEAQHRPPAGICASVALYEHGPMLDSASREPRHADVPLDVDCQVGPPPDGDGFQDLDDAFVAARRHLKAALEALRRDFRLADEEAQLRFSGGKGYHLLLISERFRLLSKKGREELLACLKGANVKLPLLFPGMGGLHLPDTVPVGGAARLIWENLAALHRSCRSPVLAQRVRGLVEHHTAIHGPETVLAALRSSSSIGSLLRQHPTWWDSLAACALHVNGPLLDGAVLMDRRRMLRVPGSINAKSGLLCRSLTIDDLDEFDPFTNANPFPRFGTVHLRGLNDASITVRGETHRVRPGEVAELPPCAGVPLAAQGAALPI